MEKSDDRVQESKCEIENGKILENASYMKVI